jgi:hypothetical protein
MAFDQRERQRKTMTSCHLCIRQSPRPFAVIRYSANAPVATSAHRSPRLLCWIGRAQQSGRPLQALSYWGNIWDLAYNPATQKTLPLMDPAEYI